MVFAVRLSKIIGKSAVLLGLGAVSRDKAWTIFLGRCGGMMSWVCLGQSGWLGGWLGEV